MKEIILITPQKSIDSEISHYCQLFENGLKTLHVRRPHYKRKKLSSFIKSIPEQYHNRIVIHSHQSLIFKFELKGIHFTSKDKKNKLRLTFLKWKVRQRRQGATISTGFHKIVSLDLYDSSYDYVFLSPIFDSISKKDYQSGFAKYNLEMALKRTNFKVYALGGVDESKVKEINDLGFHGCALLGAIWTNNNPVQAFIDFNNSCH